MGVDEGRNIPFELVIFVFFMSIAIPRLFLHLLLLPFLGLLLLGIALTQVKPHTPYAPLVLGAMRQLRSFLVLVGAGEEEGEEETAGGRHEGSSQQPDHSNI